MVLQFPTNRFHNPKTERKTEKTKEITLVSNLIVMELEANHFYMSKI